MYESHFGLSRRPFSATPDPTCFVASPAVQEQIYELLQCLRSGQGIAVLTGAPGSGKTLLGRKLAADLNGPFVTVFLANANYPTRRSLLQAVLYELGHPYLRRDESELRLELFSAIRSACAEREAAVLVVDESHLLSDELLEELRAITNLADDGRPLIRLLLIGQWALEDKLADPTLDALNQRIAAQATLEPLSQQDSAAYIAGRLKWAGAPLADLFTPSAVRLICHASDGIPRCLNLLCDHSLLLGYVAGQRPVSVEIVAEALDDLKQLPLHWNIPSSLQGFLGDSTEPETKSGSESLRETSDPQPIGSEPEQGQPVDGPRDDDETAEFRDEGSSASWNAADGIGSETGTGGERGEPVANEAGAVIEVGPDESSFSPTEDTRRAEEAGPLMEESSPEEVPDDTPQEDASPDEWIPVPFGIPDGDGWRSPEDSLGRLNSPPTGTPAPSASHPSFSPPQQAPRSSADEETMRGAGDDHTAAPTKPAAQFEEFEEEVVVDHYARLDADSSWTWTGLSRPAAEVPSATSGDSQDRDSAIEPTVDSDIDIEPAPVDSQPSFERPAAGGSIESGNEGEREELPPPREARPDEILAQMNPWLKEALQIGHDQDEAERSRSGASAAEWDEPSQLAGWPLETPGRSLEERLGLEVFDVCLETHEAVADSRNDPASRRDRSASAEFPAETEFGPRFSSPPQEGPGEPRAWFEYDVVQPEPEAPPRPPASPPNPEVPPDDRSSSSPSAADRAQTARQYKYLYNELRPRHRDW